MFKHSLRQVLSHKYIQLFSYTNQEDANSIKKRIEEYHPDVKLLYRDIGMIGDAVGSWTTSTPMTLVNEELSIWEYIGVLKDGGLKFRTRDSWNQNWGLSTFDNKHALYFGKTFVITLEVFFKKPFFG